MIRVIRMHSCSATFTVVTAPTLTVSCPGDMTVAACQSQADVDAAFLFWRNQFMLTNPGCNPTVTDLTLFDAPPCLWWVYNNKFLRHRRSV
jgi:hypothetical protein